MIRPEDICPDFEGLLIITNDDIDAVRKAGVSASWLVAPNNVKRRVKSVLITNRKPKDGTKSIEFFTAKLKSLEEHVGEELKNGRKRYKVHFENPSEVRTVDAEGIIGRASFRYIRC